MIYSAQIHLKGLRDYNKEFLNPMITLLEKEELHFINKNIEITLVKQKKIIEIT